MNDKQLIDYIIKVFKPGDHYIDIINKRTLTFEEAVLLFNEFEKDKLQDQFEQILTENEHVLECLKTRGDDYYFSKPVVDDAINNFARRAQAEHK